MSAEFWDEDGGGGGAKVEVISSNEAYAALVRGEVDMQIATAKRYPRCISKFKDTVRQMACLDAPTARECTYALPRDGKQIIGPSVRFAEICAASWQNLRVCTRIVGEDETQLTCQAVCHDLETNVAVSIEVSRRITTKTGKRYSDDMVTVAKNAGSAIAYRNAIFKVVPKAFWSPIWEESKAVARGKQGTIAELRVHTLQELEQKYKVTQAQVLAHLERRSIEDINFDDLDLLTALQTSINEGSMSVKDAFAPPQKEEENGKSAYLARGQNLKSELEAKTSGAAPSPTTKHNGARPAQAPAPESPSRATPEELWDAWVDLRKKLSTEQMNTVRARAKVDYVAKALGVDGLTRVLEAAEEVLVGK